MSFFNNLFSGEWFLKFKTPDEDKEENRSIYLNLIKNDKTRNLRTD